MAIEEASANDENDENYDNNGDARIVLCLMDERRRYDSRALWAMNQRGYGQRMLAATREIHTRNFYNFGV